MDQSEEQPDPIKSGTKDDKKTYENQAYVTTPDDVNVDVGKPSYPGDSIPHKPDSQQPAIDTRFGYGRFKPAGLQPFNKLWLLVVWLVLFCFLEGFAINGIANAALPAIERQFGLTSSKSSLIPASQDIGSLILILFVSFIGGRYNKPSWIAAGSVIMAVGSFLFIVPHLAEKYVYQGSGGPAGPTDTCGGSSGGPPPCESAGEKYVGVFMLAQIVHGIGFTPMFTLGTVYLDENSNPDTAALYVGICYAATAIGVASGFFAGGEFIENWFVDFDRVEQDSLGFDSKDTRWVGAWWLGFVFTTVAFVVVAIPMFGYPKYMPENTNAAETEAKLQNEKRSSCGQMVLDILKDFFVACLKLIKNPTFMFISLGGCAESLIIFGVSAFAFKYLAEMFHMGFDDAGLLLGGLILVGSIGMFLGGLLIKLFKLEIVGMLRLNVVATLIGCLLGIAYIAKCDEVRLAGLQISYNNQTTIDGYSAGCNTNCGCEQIIFNPVCGRDNVVYFSGCHAGCLGAPAGPQAPYTNCSCVADNLGIPRDMEATAMSGRCDDGCTNLHILAPCLFIMMIAVLTATTPASMATLRCVDEEIRPLALGASWMLLRLLGSIPGPVLIGSVIDSACLLWAGGACGTSGNCVLYSKEELSIGVLMWWVIVTAVACVLFFIASLFAARGMKKSFTLGENDKK